MDIYLPQTARHLSCQAPFADRQEYCQMKSQVSQGTGKSKEHTVSITATSGHELLTIEAGVQKL